VPEATGEPVVYRARRVLTPGPDATEALAIRGGTVLATGSARELTARYPGAEQVDLGDGVLSPGFNDVHTHLAIAAEDLLHLDLSAGAVGSLAELTAAIAREARRTPAGGWIRGSRYDDAKMREDRLLTRADLDAVAPDHPVLVVHVAGHWAVVNSAALALGGLTADSEPPDGGSFGRDAAGELNGILYEQAYFDFADPATAKVPEVVVPESDREARLAGLRRAVRMFHAAGLTSITDALTGAADLELFREAERRGDLGLKLSVLVSFEDYELVRDLPAGSDLGQGNIRLGGVKAFLDGAVGGRTCLLEQPFEGTTDDFGLQTMATEVLTDLTRMVHEDGHRLCVHANGDRAIRLLLAQLAAAQSRHEIAGTSHRIEHCTIVSEEILRQMRELGTAAIPFGSYVHYHGSKLEEWYGSRRVERMFAHRWFLDMGVPVAGSSDFPCGPYEPLLAMQSCVTRRGWDGPVLAPAQRIDAAEALSLYTTRAAELEGQGGQKGRLAPGQAADFVVLDEDPLTAAPETIGAIGVRETYVDGERVWARDTDPH
jgi:predicted amidohydrolase YtcJ